MRFLLTLLAVIVPTCVAAQVPPRIAPDSWAGPYIGFGFGAAALSSSMKTTIDCEPTGYVCNHVSYSDNARLIESRASGRETDSSVVGVGFIGYNWQMQNIVTSVEMNNVLAPSTVSREGHAVTTNAGLCAPGYVYPCSANQATFVAGAASRSDFSSELRLRLGLITNPGLLVYGLGGVAVSQSVVSNSYSDNAQSLNGTANTGKRKLSTGYVVGLGAEWAASEAWLIRTEYSRSGFGALTTSGLIHSPNPDAGKDPYRSRADLAVDKVFVALVRRL